MLRYGVPGENSLDCALLCGFDQGKGHVKCFETSRSGKYYIGASHFHYMWWHMILTWNQGGTCLCCEELERLTLVRTSLS